MATNLAHPTTQPALPRPIRMRSPRLRFVLAFVVLLVLTLLALALEQAARAADAACTAGTPDHVTCGEALVLLGYP
mgnify:CR=1 FL=1